MMGRGGVTPAVVFGSTAPGGSESPGTGVFLHGGTNALRLRVLVDIGKAHRLHRIEVMQIAPVFLEPVGCRQRLGMIAQMILAELAGGIAPNHARIRLTSECQIATTTGCLAVAEESCRSARDTYR